MTAARRRWLSAGAAAAFIFTISLAAADSLRTASAPAKIAVRASPIAAFDNSDPARTRFGALEFRGGLVLSANFSPFGGISSLHMEPDGAHFLAVTDNGSWLRARIVYDGRRPAGLADAEMAPALGPDGHPLAARGWFDMESLARKDGQFYVGIERAEKIVRFDMAKEGLAARGQPIAVPSEFKTFKFNKSLECLAAPAQGAPLAGKLIVVTERSLDAAGNHRAFLLDGDKTERFSVKRSDDFDVSDCTVLGNDLLLLERSYSPMRGVAMRIRRIPLASLKEGALVDGPALITADMGYQIDNMEGIGVHRTPEGETVLTLVSDDNFSIIQRTLLLQFAIVGE
jgi:hypothetical protein